MGSEKILIVVRQIKRCLKSQGKDSTTLLFYSGMRFGELMALTLADCDFTDNTISITKALHHKASGDLVTPPKTDNSICCISMPATIMQELKEYTQHLYALEGPDRLFTFTKSLISGNMKRSANKTGLPMIRIHSRNYAKHVKSC